MTDDYQAEYVPYGKTARLFRSVTITEKIDGTNAGIHVRENLDLPGTYSVAAQSKNRMIFPGKATDNYGFAGWVSNNAAELALILGPGIHFGEWWGSGIQRGYGMEHRVFSVFNTDRWFKTGADGLDSMATRAELSSIAGQIRAVPVLAQREFSEALILENLAELRDNGSVAKPGFPTPEGLCVWHSQSKTVYKVTLDNHDKSKWEAVS